MIEKSSAAARKKTSCQYVVLLVFWALVFSPVFAELWHTWNSIPDDSHGLLVPFVALFFLWGKREDLLQTSTSTSYLGLAVLLASLVLYLVSYAGDLAFIARLMIVSSLVGLVLFTAGIQVLRLLAFPLFFLLFMIPVPTSLLSRVSFPLQLFATQAAKAIISWFSVPVYSVGNILYFAHTQLEVVGACSGIRSVMALTMLSVLFAYIIKKRGWLARLTLIASAIPIALLANILRVAGTGVLAHFYGDQVAKGSVHDISSLIVFTFGFVLLFCEFLLLNRASRQDD